MTPRPATTPAQLAKAQIKSAQAALRRLILTPALTGLARMKRFSPRPPAMLGAYPDRASALADVPRRAIGTYDHADVAAVNFGVMCAVRVWDYPVIFWLDRLHQPGLRVLDAGGHFGTKFIAFQPLLRLHEVMWTVYDLPETIRAARLAQHREQVPAEVALIDDLTQAPPFDILLASGLLQYLDLPFPDFLARLPNRPPYILLNKVATRDGPSVTTLERIGPARVPYQIRNRAGFEAQLAETGYRIADSWDIPSLGHVIDTHPELGRSVSRGYLLQRTDCHTAAGNRQDGGMEMVGI